jgi:hypothetical protein
VATWFRTATRTGRSTSQIWRNPVKSVNKITHWLCWNPGTRHSIILGKDYTLGMENSSFISPQLIALLNTKTSYIYFKQEGTTDPESLLTVGKLVMKLDYLLHLQRNGKRYVWSLQEPTYSYKKMKINSCGQGATTQVS